MAGRRAKIEPVEEEGWIWGNNRGGGGAPLKDNNGNNISNLKKVANGSVEVDHSASPVGRKYNNKYRQEDDYDSEDNYNRSNNRRRDDDRKPANKYAQEAQHVSVSPKKGIGSFTNINNHMPDSEREAKRRKEQEFQDGLRKQIEEKQRLKDKEKNVAEKQKAAELNDYLKNHYKGSVPAHVQESSRRGVSDRDDRRRGPPTDDEDDQYNRNNKNNNNKSKFRQPDSDNDDDGDLSARNYNKKFVQSSVSPVKKGGQQGGGGGRGNNFRAEEDNYEIQQRGGQNNAKKSIRKSTEFDAHSRDRDEDDSRDRRGGGGGGGSRAVVPVKEYDELSKLCDKLMGQQDEMQAELRNQARIIEELQRGKPTASAGRGGAAPPAVVPKLAERGQRVMEKSPVKSAAEIKKEFGPLGGARSKSVQQARKGGPAAAAAANNMGIKRYGDARDYEKERVGAVKRPSSMHTITNREKIAAAANAGPPVKGGKAAFGSNSDKPSANPRRAPDPPPAAAPTKRGAAAAPPKYDRRETSSPPLPTHSKPNPINGFAKLQLGAGVVKGGPVVVTYDDDNDDNYGGGGRGGGRGGGGRDNHHSAGELRGQSDFIKMTNTHDDMINGDQLDRLLVQAKRVRN